MENTYFVETLVEILVETMVTVFPFARASSGDAEARAQASTQAMADSFMFPTAVNLIKGKEGKTKVLEIALNTREDRETD